MENFIASYQLNSAGQQQRGKVDAIYSLRIVAIIIIILRGHFLWKNHQRRNRIR